MTGGLLKQLCQTCLVHHPEEGAERSTKHISQPAVTLEWAILAGHTGRQGEVWFSGPKHITNGDL